MANTVYHIKKDGTIGVCSAKSKACPMGSENHFKSEAEAKAKAYDLMMEKFGVLPKGEVNAEKSTDQRILENLEFLVQEKKREERLKREKEEAEARMRERERQRQRELYEERERVARLNRSLSSRRDDDDRGSSSCGGGGNPCGGGGC